MRSHRTAEEARLAGYPPAWHAGNGKADEAAKKAALAHDVQPQLLASWQQHDEQAERAASTVAAIQLTRLQARTRTAEGGAVKERSRQPPALPRRLRPKGLKQKRLADTVAQQLPAAASGAAAAASVPLATLSAEELLQAKARDMPSREAAMAAVFAHAAPA